MDGTCTGEHGVGQGKMKYLAGRARRAGARGDAGDQAGARPARHHEPGQDRNVALTRSGDTDLAERVGGHRFAAKRRQLRAAGRLGKGRACRHTMIFVRPARAGPADAEAGTGASVQTTLLGIAIALILALLAALVGPYFVNWNDHRAFFEAEASRLVGLNGAGRAATSTPASCRFRR